MILKKILNVSEIDFKSSFYFKSSFHFKSKPFYFFQHVQHHEPDPDRQGSSDHRVE